MGKTRKKAHVATRGKQFGFRLFRIGRPRNQEVWANQIEAARKTMARFTNNAGKIWIRIFTDMPVSQSRPKSEWGKGKNDPVGFV